VFPTWSHPLLAFMAIGIDFDDINARMAPDNRAVAGELMAQLSRWDAEKQLSQRDQFDNVNLPQIGGFRPNAINIS
jgi:hypothetical protein